MTAAIIFPDVELELTGYLRTALAANGYTIWTAASPGDAKVYVSNTRGTQTTAVWVRRDGGPVLDQVRETARVGINVFAGTEQAVNNLARTVSALMRAAPDGAPIVRVTQPTGPTPIADSPPRRYMAFEVTVRGSEL